MLLYWFSGGERKEDCYRWYHNSCRARRNDSRGAEAPPDPYVIIPCAVPSRPILGGLHIAEQQVAPCKDADQLLVPHNRHACEGSVLKEFGHLK